MGSTLLIALLLTTLGIAAPRGYEAAVSTLPETHWALVVRADAILPPDQGHTFPDRRIEVPRQPDDHVLIHEVGHVVALARPDLEAAYWASTTHGRLDMHESFAEAYRAVVEGRQHRAAEWMRANVMGQIAAPRSIPPEIIAPAPVSSPCASAGLPSGSIVAGCSAVPTGSVRP